MILDHEQRLTKIETSSKDGKDDSKDSKDDSLKSQLLIMLAKGLLAAVIAIGALAGATPILKEIFK